MTKEKLQQYSLILQEAKELEHTQKNLEKAYLSRQVKVMELATEIEAFIQSLSDPLHRRILHLRYVECLEWWQIANKTSYSRSQVIRIHGQVWQLI